MSGRAREFVLAHIGRAYAWMTLAYPPSFRTRFGREMRLAFRDEAGAIAEASGVGGLLNLTLRVAADWIITLSKEYGVMPRQLLAAALVLTLFAVDWLAFHDWREPHSLRDYLTLAASLLVFAYIGLDLFRGRKDATPRTQ